MPKIFVDTWAWYALADINDTDHQLAREANIRLLDDGYTFVISNYVLSEAVTLIRYKMYHAAAVQFWHTMQQLIERGLLELVHISPVLESVAWSIFEKYADQDFSFVDCTSFAVMRDMGLSEVFTADHHFATMGFILTP